MDGTSEETLATYVARYCVAREDYTTQVPPEAAELVQACDIVLTRLSWGTLQILCIVDAQTNPGKQFDLMPRRVREIAAACRKYSGSINLSKLPAIVEIVEISGGSASEADRARLKHYRRSSVFSKAVVLASHVNAHTGQVWRNRWQLNRTTVEKILRQPRVSEAELLAEVENRPLPAPARAPLMTWGFLVALVAVFALEVLFKGPEPDTRTLIALGGLDPKLVAGGEWWRVFSATVLHANFGHLLANAFSLYIAGRVLENMVGRTWFAATYVIAGMVGALGTIAGGAHFAVSVGASGAIIGVAAAAAVCGLTRRRAQFGGEAVQLLVSVLVPTLGLVMWGGQRAAHVDHFAHFGGAAGGALAALLMLGLWELTDPMPRIRGLAAGIAGFWCLGLAYAAVEVAKDLPDYAVTLMPEGAMPADVIAQESRVQQLVERYPDDPRPLYALGVAQFQRREFAGAEKSLRKALTMEKTLDRYFNASLTVRIRSLLVATLQASGKGSEAKAVAAPLCALPPGRPLFDDYTMRVRSTVCN